MKKILSIVLLAGSLLLGYFSQAEEIHGLRNQRYCEIFLGNLHKILFSYLKVYNTIGLTDCPQALWQKISLSQIKHQYGFNFVRQNGPRYWTVDGLCSSSLLNNKPLLFGSLWMHEVAVLKLPGTLFLSTPKYYTQHTVHRLTTWVYERGRPVYELVDPTGHIFIMQSYSIQKIPQTISTLANLGSKLQLPVGWKFRTRVLNKSAYLKPDKEQAIVIQDDFLNTYQLETTSFRNQNA